MLDPENKNLNSSKGVLRAKALVVLCQNIPACLINVNSYPVTLRNDTILGRQAWPIRDLLKKGKKL